MRILAVDTSGACLCAALYDGSRVYGYTVELGRKLSSLLLPSIDRMLGCLGWSMEGIDYFVCGLGPGSFTALRIGMAAMKGFSWALKKPLIGIPTLDIIAKNAYIQDGYIIPVVDAKRKLIYSAFYKVKSGVIRKISPYMLLGKEEFLAKAEKKVSRSGLNVIFLGDALELYKTGIMLKINKAVFLDRDHWYPQPNNLITLALEKIKGKKTGGSFNLNPIYLYQKECQIRGK